MQLVFIVYLYLNLFVVLGERIAHISLKFSHCKIEFTTAVSKEVFDNWCSECPNKWPLIVWYNFIEVFFDKLWFEIGKIKAAIVVRGKLICDIEYYFVRVLSSYEPVS